MEVCFGEGMLGTGLNWNVPHCGGAVALYETAMKSSGGICAS